MEKRKLRSPFFVCNPKAYLYGEDTLKLAKKCEELAVKYDFDVIYTAQHVDLAMIAKECPHLIVTAQSMESLKPGRGMGHILPEGMHFTMTAYGKEDLAGDGGFRIGRIHISGGSRNPDPDIRRIMISAGSRHGIRRFRGVYRELINDLCRHTAFDLRLIAVGDIGSLQDGGSPLRIGDQ